MNAIADARGLERLADEWQCAWPSLFGSKSAVDAFFREHRVILEQLVVARGDVQQTLHGLAHEVREGAFGRTAVVRGVVEWTNICSRHCNYCPMRADNQKSSNVLTQFKLDANDLVRAARRILADGLSVIFIQGGEVPTIKPLLEAIRTIRCETSPRIEILVNVGTLTRQRYRELRHAGVNSCIIKLEEYDPTLAEAATGYSYRERYARIQECVMDGFKVGTGFILGLPGQTRTAVARNLLMFLELGAHMASVAPFVPARHTPMSSCDPADGETALNCMALMRLLDPSVMMPSVSAMSKVLPGAQERGFAFATTLTANYTELHREQYQIYGKERNVVTRDVVDRIVTTSGLKSRSSDQMWSIQDRIRQQLRDGRYPSNPGEHAASVSSVA